MTNSSRPAWTPAMEEWAIETLSRSKPLSVRQLDTVTAAFRRTVNRNQDRVAA